MCLASLSRSSRRHSRIEHGVQYCYAVSSGTDGNHMVLWALGLGPGDEVIMPANTFIATAWGATLCGATPVFVDCEADSYNIDPKKVEAKITPKTKAIVAVHLYGQPADMDPLNEIAKKHKIALVEDCAQSHLAEYKGKRTGGLVGRVVVQLLSRQEPRCVRRGRSSGDERC